MFQPFEPGVFTPTVCDGYYAENYTSSYIANYAANTVAVSTTMSSSSPPHYEPVRHMLFGSIAAVQNTIKLLYVLNYAEPNDWSHPVPSGQPGEVVVVLTKKVRIG
ncbi:MAG: hypothetical protein AAGD25_00470 [Cyanobacteria bacterium P01_F01_bin.150]